MIKKKDFDYMQLIGIVFVPIVDCLMTIVTTGESDTCVPSETIGCPYPNGSSIQDINSVVDDITWRVLCP